MLLEDSGEGLGMPERGIGKRDVCYLLLGRVNNPFDLRSHICDGYQLVLF